MAAGLTKSKGEARRLIKQGGARIDGDKITDIDEKMASLAQMKSALERLAAKCRGKGPTDDCPILAEIDGDGEL